VNKILVDNLPPTYFPVDTFWCPGTVLTLENPFLDPGTGSNWTPLLQINQVGTYYFSGVNANRCPETASVEVNTCCNEKRIYVPNIFSPNADGDNDSFCVYTIPSCSNYQLRIFDRWGSLMFVGNNGSSCWDGTFRSKQVLPGVYTWFLQYESQETGKSAILKGSVTLIR
jgi:gliding motility-associated-like protein